MPVSKVIIAEDDKVTRQLISRIVEKAGRTPIEATTGRRAWEVLQDNPDTALLITDMMMPEIDGRELIHRVRSDPNLSSIPIIIVSGAVKLHEIVDLLEVGASRFVPKPLNAREFAEYVLHLTKSSESQPGTKDQRLPN